MRLLKHWGKSLAGSLGLELRRRQPAAGTSRPVGQLLSVLEDLRSRGFSPSLVIDVGASDGAWTHDLRSVYPAPRVVMIEPRPQKRPALDELSRRDPRCTPVTAAVGAAIGQATLTDWDTGSTLLAVDPGEAPQFAVPVTTLDAVAAEWGVPDLVKLDVEGFELQALQGATRLFGITELFIVEVALFRFVDRPMLHDVVAFMAARGYVVYDVAGFIRRPYDGAVGLLDLCFARAAGPLRRREDAWQAGD